MAEAKHDAFEPDSPAGSSFDIPEAPATAAPAIVPVTMGSEADDVTVLQSSWRQAQEFSSRLFARIAEDTMAGRDASSLQKLYDVSEARASSLLAQLTTVLYAIMPAPTSPPLLSRLNLMFST